MLFNTLAPASRDRLAPDAETPIAPPGAASPSSVQTDRSDSSAAANGRSGVRPPSRPRAEIHTPEIDADVKRAFAEAQRAQDEVAGFFDQREGAASVLAQWQRSIGDLARRRDGAAAAAATAGLEMPEHGRLKRVTSEQTPLLDHLERTARAALDAADRSLREHRQLATTASAAAEAARSAHAASTQVLVKQPLVAAFERQERALLQRLSTLQETQAECNHRYEAAAQLALSQNDLTRPLLEEENALKEVGLEIMTRQASLSRTRQMLGEARNELQSLEKQAADAQARAATSGQTHTAQAARTGDADAALRDAIACRDAVQSDADAGLQRLHQVVSELCVALRPPAPATAPGAPDVRQIADRWRGHLHALRSRFGPARGEMTIGPLTLASVDKKPTRLRDAPSPSRRPTTSASKDALKAIDAKTRTAKADA
ncbi:MAG: hypothetical protein ABW220_05435, partial [Burkholderiaceae bacterium]